jgi:hypothetical protein
VIARMGPAEPWNGRNRARRQARRRTKGGCGARTRSGPLAVDFPWDGTDLARGDLSGPYIRGARCSAKWLPGYAPDVRCTCHAPAPGGTAMEW